MLKQNTKTQGWAQSKSSTFRTKPKSIIKTPLDRRIKAVMIINIANKSQCILMRCQKSCNMAIRHQDETAQAIATVSNFG